VIGPAKMLDYDQSVKAKHEAKTEHSTAEDGNRLASKEEQAERTPAVEIMIKVIAALGPQRPDPPGARMIGIQKLADIRRWIAP